MKTASNYPKSSAHAATTRVAGTCAQNLANSTNSQVKSSSIAAGEGLVWDETTAAAFETIRGVIAHELAKYDLCEYAEDVYQDTYLAAFHTPSRVGPSQGELGAWFRGIARYVARMCVRRVLRNEVLVLSLDAEQDLDVEQQDLDVEQDQQLEHILQALSSAVGHHVAYERALVTAFRYDGDTGAAAEFLGIPRRTVQWSQQMVRKFGIVIARALTVRTAREEYGKAHKPVTVGELMWCLPPEVDAADYVRLLGQAGSVEKVSKADLMTVTGLSSSAALQYASEVVRMLSIARSVVETGTLAIAEEEA